MPRILAIFLIVASTACTTQQEKTTLNQADKPRVETTGLEAEAGMAYENGDWQSSEQLYKQLVNSHPEEAVYWYRLANIYANTNRTDAAVIAYRQAISIEPAHSDAWYNLGLAHLKQASYSFNAIESLENADETVSRESNRLLEGILRLLEQ